MIEVVIFYTPGLDNMRQPTSPRDESFAHLRYMCPIQTS